MNDSLRVQPFSAPAEYEAMIDYFLGGSAAFLRGMGVDVPRLPTREEWLRAALRDAELPDSERDRYYVAWIVGGELVGHSSISHITWGDSAHGHLHLWRQDLRRSGVGTALLAKSLDLYFERFELRTLASEPYADNPAPNRALPKLGFRLVRRYRTVPTSLGFEQEVNRYELTRTEWTARRGERGVEPRRPPSEPT